MRSLNYIKICGPGVDRLEARKECAQRSEITESELRLSLERAKGDVIAGITMLAEAQR